MEQGQTTKKIFGSDFHWSDPERVASMSYLCGFCNDKVSSDKGYKINNFSDGSGNTFHYKGIYICPSCKGPTFFDFNERQFPGKMIGNFVEEVPPQIASLYTEARNSFSGGAYTGTVLLARKMLMNIAVHFGADENKNFIFYVNYLSDEGYINKSNRGWIDYIRLQGNEATHKIELKSEKEAENILKFIEMLLKTNYEYPSYVISSKEN